MVDAIVNCTGAPIGLVRKLRGLDTLRRTEACYLLFGKCAVNGEVGHTYTLDYVLFVSKVTKVPIMHWTTAFPNTAEAIKNGSSSFSSV